MSLPNTPEDWALFVNLALDQAYGRERHPMSIAEAAQAFSHSRFPAEPIATVRGGDLEGFEGALIRDPSRRKGWGIFFNAAEPSKRRARFTIAHEFGHYLMHRYFIADDRDGFYCHTAEVPVDATPMENPKQEREADRFAANLLMPPYDLERRISPFEATDLNMLSCCADHYGVSMLAIIQQWLRLTRLRAVLVVSRDDFVLWSAASRSAQGLRRRAFGPPDGEPVEIPAQSLAAQRELTSYPKEGAPMAPGVWFPDEAALEMAIFADRYDFIASLLLLDFE
ncbi:ImmA/IrrE family metallo-endopeptidase [Magnetofaba australis]|uniref:Putative Zn peptidase n=1 Tax=Magnetofaba australis IT-1 TaxID=1434232 RepID=A0A1Y2K1W6_9PROT|nr:ImmA/IrrE family metallo-endopeptidase [Magnetofaba australis]OSM02003.1 putative Zn peptidase [Magnetofaba australis IT-1]